MVNIIVTGGAGYIGSHACKALAAAGFRPITFDNLKHGHTDAVKWGPLINGDLNIRKSIDDALSKYNPAAVLHFAAYAYVGESVQYPLIYYRNNVAGSLNLLEAMIAAGVKNLVFSSTCATYGVPQSIPIPEEHQQNPVNPYGSSKLMMEKMILDTAKSEDFKSVILRYFNAAGADPDCEIGEDHNPETHLIPLVLDAALGRIPFVTINGDDYETIDGTCIRDYIHVSDLADAHVLALQYLLKGGTTTSFNLSNGIGFSVREVIEAVEKVTGRLVPVKVGARRPGDPSILIGDATRANNVLGWRPRLGNLDKQIEDALRWRAK